MKTTISRALMIASFALASTAHAKLIADFHARDLNGQEHTLHEAKDASALVLIAHGASCGVLRQLTPAIQELKRTYGPRGVRFLFVNGNLQDDPARLRRELKDYALDIPLLIDSDQKILRDTGLHVTSEAAIVDPKTGALLFRGAINDQVTYDTPKKKADHEYVRDALEQILKGERVSVPTARAFGCQITLQPPARDTAASRP